MNVMSRETVLKRADVAIRLTHLIPDILELVDNSVLKEKEVL